MNNDPRILSLPSAAFVRLYTFVNGFQNVELEVDRDGALLTSSRFLLRVCRQMRRIILASCHTQKLRLVYTVRAPSAVRHLPYDTTTVLRLVLLSQLESIPLTTAEERGVSSGSHTDSLFKAWREAFREIPSMI